MPSKNPDLHQNAPDDSGTALVIIDMINDLEFPGGEDIYEPALAAAKRIRRLKERAKALSIPVIYVNDNFGRWRSDFREAVQRCLTTDVRGRMLAELLEPDPDDYFVLKPKHSAFYATTFETLLTYLGCKRLVLTGISGNMCVQFTACDAYMRDYYVHVPEDCTASNSAEANRDSLNYIEQVLKADTTRSENLELGRLAGSD